MDYRDQRVLVMGLGVHGGGVGVARFLAERGAAVTVTDIRSEQQLARSLEKLGDLSINYVLGRHREMDFASADLVVRNPAVPVESPYLRVATVAGVPIVMEMTLFFEECPSQKIIGVTGTKGKTTTTLLIGALLQEHGLAPVVAGNLRRSALETLPRVSPESWVVLELSSWQLEGLIPLRRSPHISVITGITPDHLDRYGSFDEYAESKGLILRWQGSEDWAVLNRQSRHLRELGGQARSRVVWFDQGSKSPGWEKACLYGAHNQANVAAAVAVARLVGLPDTTIFRTVATFPGVPHRLEMIREHEGVRYINDSTATTPSAMMAALDSVQSRIVLIAGGSDKGLEYSSLRPVMQDPESRVAAVVLLEGSATAKIRAVCEPKVIEECGSLADAVTAACVAAHPGTVVLLSPGCASFGMFVNEFDRGDHFRKLVEAIS